MTSKKLFYKINPFRLFLKIIFISLYIQKISEIFLDKKKLHRALRNLKNKKLDIKVVYDIGARYGRWSKGVSKIFLKANFYLFEASEKCRPFLAKQRFPFFIEVLSSRIQDVTFYESDTPGDSYYKDKSSIYKKTVGVTKKTSTLSSMIMQKKIPPPDFIKLDTQGSEIDILKGCMPSLKNVKLLYIECPVIDINEGAPKFNDYMNFMTKNGFVPYDICERHIHNNALLQIDILFINKSLAIKMGLISKKHWSFSYL